MKNTILCFSLFIVAFTLHAQSAETIQFPSKDGVTITADLYMTYDKSASVIILFHQANWSRGEYVEIAPELNSLGFNCLAVDLRSGGMVNNKRNDTKQSALKNMKSTQYVDAIADMKASIEYAESLTDKKVIIWGSSYSSALALKLAATMPAVDAVLAFSPAEYFVSQGKPRDFITSDAGNLDKPVFITSAKSEKGSWWGMYVAIPSDKKQYFLPETSGNHGSKALWSKFSDSKEYWVAVNSFLKSL